MNFSKSLLALALAACGAGAFAQSSVTISGRLDAGVVSIDNGARSSRLDGGNYTTPRLAFRGTEDLGGGLSALFFMETGIATDTGAAPGGTRFWNRGSYVGLTSKDLGTLTLGRQFVPMFYPFLFVDDSGPMRFHNFGAVQSIQRSHFLRVNQKALTGKVANGNLASGTAGIFSVGATSGLENNLIIYKTPSMSGLTLSGAVGAGESNVDSAKVFSGNAEYRNGGLFLSAGVNQKRGAVSATGAEQRVDEAILSGKYALNANFSVWGDVHNWKVNAGAGSSISGNDFMLGVTYKTGAHWLWADMARKSVGSCTQCDSQGFALGYHYSFSKRTEFYSFYSKVGNDSNAANVLNGFAPIAAGRDVSGLGAGIAHQF